MVILGLSCFGIWQNILTAEIYDEPDPHSRAGPSDSSNTTFGSLARLADHQRWFLQNFGLGLVQGIHVDAKNKNPFAVIVSIIITIAAATITNLGIQKLSRGTLNLVNCCQWLWDLPDLGGNAIGLLVGIVDNRESLQGLEGFATLLLVHGDASQVVQLLPLLSRDVCAHVPGISQGQQGLVVGVLDCLLPLLLGTALCFDRLDTLLAEFLDQVNDNVDLAFDEDGPVGECRGCW